MDGGGGLGNVPGEPGQSAEGRRRNTAWSWQLASSRRKIKPFYYSGFRGTPGNLGGKSVQESY